MGYIDQTLAGHERILFRARLHWIIYRGALFVLTLGALLFGVGFYNAGADVSAMPVAGRAGLLEQIPIKSTRHCEPTGPARSGRPDDRLHEAIQGPVP